MCEYNLTIVKICQKCANFESGSLSEKLLRIEKVAQNPMFIPFLTEKVSSFAYFPLKNDNNDKKNDKNDNA